MGSYIIGADRQQKILFPESVEEYIEAENPVRLFDGFVEALDMSGCGFNRALPAREGRPGYDPRDMLKLYIYGYFNKIRSSRKLEKEAGRNVELMWLVGKLVPDFRSIADFRKDNKKALKEVFREFNRFCDGLGLYTKEYISIDGSKFKALNAKDRNFTLSKLDDRLKRLDEHIEEYMGQLDSSDEAGQTVRKLPPTAKNL
jgi:transposase